VTATRVYDAFGNVASSTGTWSSPFGYAVPFGYQEDNDSGLKLLGHRYYDSSTGRFLSRDPAKDGRNWYLYCANRPLTSVDPSGLTFYYDQRSGIMWWDDPSTKQFDPVIVGFGFSGKGKYRNDPNSQGKEDWGPIPAGKYKIGKRRSRKSNGKKLDNFPLTPDIANEMYGRDAFLIHGGSPDKEPSEGCIIMQPDVRDFIENSGDDDLVVFDPGPTSFFNPFPSPKPVVRAPWSGSPKGIGWAPIGQ
jgi:RHS repeat-associated protein